MSMTLEEAILHCEEVADRCAVTDGDRLCEDNHRQLAEWLQELKKRRAQEKEAHWEFAGDGVYCSGGNGCGQFIPIEHHILATGTLERWWMRYCPNCGAKMYEAAEV